MVELQVVDVDMPALDSRKIGEWVVQVAQTYGKSVGKICYLFCSDDYILRINREYLNHDYYTDIITFDYTSVNRIGGDLVISVDTVASNAAEIGEDPSREMLRVVIHGVLHLCGINDKGPGERQIMELAENRALALYDKMFL